MLGGGGGGSKAERALLAVADQLHKVERARRREGGGGGGGGRGGGGGSGGSGGSGGDAPFGQLEQRKELYLARAGVDDQRAHARLQRGIETAEGVDQSLVAPLPRHHQRGGTRLVDRRPVRARLDEGTRGGGEAVPCAQHQRRAAQVALHGLAQPLDRALERRPRGRQVAADRRIGSVGALPRLTRLALAPTLL